MMLKGNHAARNCKQIDNPMQNYDVMVQKGPLRLTLSPDYSRDRGHWRPRSGFIKSQDYIQATGI